MNITPDTIKSHIAASGHDLAAAVRSLSAYTGCDTRTVRQRVLETMGWRDPGRYASRDVGRGYGRSERGRHR